MGQVGRSLALLLTCASALQSPSPVTTATPNESPGPRQSIAGMKSIECSSTVVYAKLPGAPHRLQADYAFPDRARWWLGVGTELSTRRRMLFRFGTACYALDPDTQFSRRLEGPEQQLTCIQLEMRRALLLWPAGFAWQRDGKQASAAIPPLGTLGVVFADAQAKTPISLSFTDSNGNPGDEYRAIAWRTEKDKAWPTRFELWHDKVLVWSETVDAIDTGTRFIDSFFVPPDTREKTAARPLEVGAVRPADLPENRSQRVALQPRTSWDAARAEQARLVTSRKADLESHGLKLEGPATFEVSEDLQPTAVVLRLAPCREPLDPALAKDWPLTRERPGISTFVMGLPALTPPHLADLRAAVPRDAQCGQPYVRFDPAHPDQHVMLLLPLAPRADPAGDDR